MLKLPKMIPAPTEKPKTLEAAKWLSGEGAGSWFLIEQYKDSQSLFRAYRYSDKGSFECGGSYQSNKRFDPFIEFKLTYPSHCLKITVEQEGEIITLELITKLFEKDAY